MAREGLDYGLLGEVVEDPEKPSVRIKRQGHPPDVKDAFSALQTGSTRNRKRDAYDLNNKCVYLTQPMTQI